jgi:hypothetical protein
MEKSPVQALIETTNTYHNDTQQNDSKHTDNQLIMDFIVILQYKGQSA